MIERIIYLTTNGSTVVIHNMEQEEPTKKVTGTISKEINAIDSMTFCIYPDNPGYSSIHSCLTSVLCMNGDEVEFFGRVLKATPSMDNIGVICKQVTCEGTLAYLQDSSTEYKEYTGGTKSILTSLINRHNVVVPTRQIYINFATSIKDDSITYQTTGSTTYEEFMAVVNAAGYEVSVSYTIENGAVTRVTVNVNLQIGGIANSSIEIGENLLSFQKDDDMTTLVTRVYPLGAKLYTDDTNLEYLTIASVNSGSNVLENNVEQYGTIMRTLLFPDITDAAELKSEAQKYLDANCRPVASYSISALDPSLLDSTKDPIKLGYYYTVNAPELDILNTTLRITAKNTCIENPANDSFSVGKTVTSTATVAGAVTDTTISKIYETVNTNQTINAKQIEAVKGQFEELFAKSITTDNLTAKVAELGYASVDLLEVVDGKIDTLESKAITADNVTSDFSNTVVGKVDDAIITNAMIKNVAADKIASGRISTNDVEIGSDDGLMLLKDETMIISDGEYVRVQIGKDSTGDFNMVLLDSTGNLLWDARGLGEAGIRDELIVDRMVSADAAINGGKIDLPSLIHEINESDGTETIKSSMISYDPTGQTLDIAFSSATSKLLDNIGFNLYSDSLTMSEDWVYNGTITWSTNDNIRIAVLGSQYAYVDSTFELTEGVTYTISAFIKGSGFVYYPNSLEKCDDFSSEDYTRVSYTFVYDKLKGKPVFSSIGTMYLYKMKCEYGGYVSDWCMTASEENRESIIKTANIEISIDNLSSSMYQVTGELTKYSNLSQTVDDISVTVGELESGMSNYATTEWTTNQISSKVSSGDVCSVINQSSDTIELKSNRLVVESDQFTLDDEGNASFGGNLSAAEGTFSGTIEAYNSTVEDGTTYYNKVSITPDSIGMSYGATSGASEYGARLLSINKSKAIINSKKTTFGGDIKAGNMESGTASITPKANEITAVWVPFGKTFSSPPAVIATPCTTVPGSTVQGVSVYGVTTEGFYLYILRTNTTTTSVYWIAFGEA